LSKEPTSEEKSTEVKLEFPGAIHATRTLYWYYPFKETQFQHEIENSSLVTLSKSNSRKVYWGYMPLNSKSSLIVDRNLEVLVYTSIVLFMSEGIVEFTVSNAS